MKPPEHQFSLFDHNTMRPRFKVPISAARIAEVKKLIDDGDGRGAAEKMRDLREGLMARDLTAPETIGEWIKCNIGIQPPEKLHEALDAAIEMRLTQKQIHDRIAQEEMDRKFGKNK